MNQAAESNVEAISETVKPDKLNDGRYLITCRLNSDIDPDQWADLCRKIGQLRPRVFKELYETLNEIVF